MTVPFWFEDRSKPATLERERKHLADMQAHERRMQLAGYEIRLGRKQRNDTEKVLDQRVR